MRPKERRDSGQSDLLRARLDQILNMDHALVKLAKAIDWRFLEERLGEVYDDDPGRPPLPTRLMAGLAILKSMHNLSDEGLCERWLENPYYQLFCGEEFFQHRLVFDRTSLTRWRLRMGEERLTALLQESLAAATRLGAAKPADFRAVIVDTTVQEKAITFPTDAKLMQRARERLVKLAKKHGVVLRQSYARLGKFALIKHQRYAHAKQFKRANRQLKRLRTMLGAVIRDIARKIAGQPGLMQIFGLPLSLARRVRDQRQRERGRKVYSLHAPEVECIGKGKAHKPYESGVKVSVATTLKRSRGGQFVAHVKALPGNPYDGHTLATISQRSRRRSASTSPRSSPMPAIVATTPRRTRPSRSVSPATGAASPRPSSGRCDGGPPSSPSSAISRPITAWAATSWPSPKAMPTTPCSPPSATISASCSTGWGFCAPSSWRCSQPQQRHPSGRE